MRISPISGVLFMTASLYLIPGLWADFASPTDVSNGAVNGVTVLDAADLNGDGLLDIAAACGGAHANGGKLYAWFEQKATGAWTRHDFGNSSSFDDFVGSAKCADIDGDGDQDFIMAVDGHTSGPIKVYVYENPGSAAVSGSWTNYLVTTITGVHANDMRIADMDGNGKPDVVLRHKEPHDVVIIFQDSKTSWSVKLVGTKNGEGLAVGDLNGDGRPDISVSGEWYQAPSSPRTQNYSKFILYNYSNIATKDDIGDINGDGFPDVLLSPAESFSYYGTSGTHDLAWFENPGNPASVSSWTKHVLKSAVNDLSFARLGDFDGDGDLDVASGKDFSGTANYLKIYFNDNLNFSRIMTLASDKGIYSGAVKDMDGDGDLDLAGENDYAGSSKPYFYKNLSGPYGVSTPAAPTVLSGPVPTGPRVDLSWVDNATNESGFKIERKSGGGVFQQVAQTGAGVVTFSNVVQENTSYTYRIKAYNTAGDSAYSNEHAVTVPAGVPVPVAPVAPRNLRVVE